MGNRRQSLWVKLACDYFDDERILLVGPDAELLFVRGLAWAKRENDGMVGHGALVRLGIGLPAPLDCALTLAKVGLWVEVPGGYQIANWGDWQTGGEDIDRKAKAGALGNHRRWHASQPSLDCPICIAEASHRDRTCDADAIPETETETEKPPTRLTASEFADWWDAWPKKVARGAAAKAYTKARRTATADVLLAAARAVAAEWRTLDADRRQFVPHPATWLNQERWLDATSDPTPNVPVVRGWTADPACPDCYGDGWRTVDAATNTLGPCECRVQP